MLNHQGTLPLETKRLLLRRFTMDDADGMFNNWANDKEVCKFLRWSPHKDIAETKSIVSSWINSYENPSFYQWAITFKDHSAPIGAIGLLVVNENDLCGDFGYNIGKKYWGQGITTEALRAVLDFAFETVGFNRIEAYPSINNPGSGKVMQKSGMLFEGVAKQRYRSISGFEDCNMYSILKKDFNKNLE